MTLPQLGFGARLARAYRDYGQLCVGIDPHPGMLTAWGLSDDAAGLREFGRRVIAASAGRAAAVKPQVAFFENYGLSGMVALADIIADAKQAGLLVIADAKRGDIGSTMAAYAAAWLNPQKDFGADALTVSPYLGFGSLAPAVEAAQRYRGGLFVLALTSNPEGREVQLASHEQGVASVAASRTTVAGHIVTQVQQINTMQQINAAQQANTAQQTNDDAAATDPAAAGDTALGDIGLVVGGTTASLASRSRIDLTAGRPALLAPGYGAQGATAEQLREGFGPAWSQVLVNSSRAILQQGPNVADLIDAIEAVRTDLR
ncbi:MAG: orotidine-5'-phosphate decarboxylase [Nesterenkonia sp.]